MHGLGDLVALFQQEQRGAAAGADVVRGDFLAASFLVVAVGRAGGSGGGEHGFAGVEEGGFEEAGVGAEVTD